MVARLGMCQLLRSMADDFRGLAIVKVEHFSLIYVRPYPDDEAVLGACYDCPKMLLVIGVLKHDPVTRT